MHIIARVYCFCRGYALVFFYFTCCCGCVFPPRKLFVFFAFSFSQVGTTSTKLNWSKVEKKGRILDVATLQKTNQQKIILHYNQNTVKLLHCGLLWQSPLLHVTHKCIMCVCVLAGHPIQSPRCPCCYCYDSLHSLSEFASPVMLADRHAGRARDVRSATCEFKEGGDENQLPVSSLPRLERQNTLEPVKPTGTTLWGFTEGRLSSTFN